MYASISLGFLFNAFVAYSIDLAASLFLSANAERNVIASGSSLASSLSFLAVSLAFSISFAAKSKFPYFKSACTFFGCFNNTSDNKVYSNCQFPSFSATCAKPYTASIEVFLIWRAFLNSTLAFSIFPSVKNSFPFSQ